MRVRVDYTTTVSNDFRRAINAWYGRPGLASRAEVKEWFRAYGSSMDDDLMIELDAKEQAIQDCIADYGGAP